LLVATRRSFANAWAIKTKAIGARKGWMKALTEDLKIDQKTVADANKKAVMMNDLAYQPPHYVMHRQIFLLCPCGTRLRRK